MKTTPLKSIHPRRYAVGINKPGYLPGNDPSEHDDYIDAVEALRDELDRDADPCEDYVICGEYVGAMRLCRQYKHAHLQTGADCNIEFYINGNVYFLYRM